MKGVLRRDVLRAGGVLVGSMLLPRVRVAAEESYSLPERARKALEESPYVYVSPLHRDGKESRCHGEVWFMFDGGDVLLSTARSTWKARALGSGRDRARIWVGDFGQGGSVGERFREGPSFLARAGEERDRAALDRLLAAFGKKYPDGWGRWAERFEKGFTDGSRTLIRYAPIAG